MVTRPGVRRLIIASNVPDTQTWRIMGTTTSSNLFSLVTWWIRGVLADPRLFVFDGRKLGCGPSPATGIGRLPRGYLLLIRLRRSGETVYHHGASHKYYHERGCSKNFNDTFRNLFPSFQMGGVDQTPPG